MNVIKKTSIPMKLSMLSSPFFLSLLLFQEGCLASQYQKRQHPDLKLKGTGSCLNLSYSIIFTETTFYPESSNLIQIILINHMTF